MYKGILIGTMLTLGIAGVYFLGVQQGKQYVAPINEETPVALPGGNVPVDPPAAEKKTTQAPVKYDQNPIYACAQDSDCVSVRGDACGCSSGGTATAVNAKYKNSWESGLGTSICIAMISNHPTCSMTPRCVSGQCVLRN